MRTFRLIVAAAIVVTALATTGGAAVARSDTEPEYAAIDGSMDVSHQIGERVVETFDAVPQERVTHYDWVLSVTTNDPRLSGRYDTFQNYYLFAPGETGGAVRSGRGRLSNEGGSWLVEFQGFTQPGTSVYTGNHYVGHFTGEGGYEGLSAMTLSMPTGMGQWDVIGVLYPGPMPPFPPPLPPAE